MRSLILLLVAACGSSQPAMSPREADVAQHNPNVPEAWRAAIEKSPLRHEAVVWDLFRIDAGAIAEHWITYEEIPAHMAHSNGMF